MNEEQGGKKEKMSYKKSDIRHQMMLAEYRLFVADGSYTKPMVFEAFVKQLKDAHVKALPTNESYFCTTRPRRRR